MAEGTMKPTLEEIESHRDRLEKLVYQIVGRDWHAAEDVASTAIMKALQLTEVNNIGAWLTTTAKREAIDWQRKQDVIKADELRDDDVIGQTGVDFDKVERVLQKLPLQLRLALSGVNDSSVSEKTHRRRLEEARLEFKKAWILED